MDLLQCGQKMTLPIMKFRTGSTCVWLHLKQRTGMSHESTSGRGTKLTSGSAYADEAPVLACWVVPLVTSVAGLLAADAALAGASAFALAATAGLGLFGIGTQNCRRIVCLDVTSEHARSAPLPSRHCS